MATDQHFCLRWNNHQSTLISVFDTLLESGTLVDCTLAADGQQLKAHKVVLSACSPYLEALLSQHYDKHPIIILRDVKFPELKAMLDYMYRGEVNITQEQLGTFLKAAESLQIKGLTDSGGGGGGGGEIRDGLHAAKRHGDIRKQVPLPAAITPQSRTHPVLMESRKSVPHIPPHVLDIPPSSPLKAREGSVSPVIRKRRKPNQPIHNDDAKLVQTPTALHAAADGVVQNSPGEPPCLAPSTPASGSDHAAAANNNSTSAWTNKTSSEPPPGVGAAINAAINKVVPPETTKSDSVVKSEHLEQLLQPKTEFADDIMNDNENSVDERDMDDDDDEESLKMDMSKPGPSQATNTQGFGSWMEDDSSNEEPGGPGNQHNSQGYSQWPVSTDGSADETMINAPPQDSQGSVQKYLNQMQMVNWEAWSAAHPSVPKLLCHALSYSPPAGEPFKGVECPKCGRHYKLKSSLRNHQKWECGKEPQFQCPYCNYRAKQKMHVARHIERMHREKLEMLEVNERATILKDEKPFTA